MRLLSLFVFLAAALTFSGNVWGHPPGTEDPSFQLDPAVGMRIHSMVEQPDGKILIGGETPSNRPAVRRLHADGSIDATFEATLEGYGKVTALLLQPDGHILVGGKFERVGGEVRKSIARLSAEGALDESFLLGAEISGMIHSIAFRPDGRIVVGGDFSLIVEDGGKWLRLASLMPDGAIDQTFEYTGALSSPVTTVLTQPDGRILLAGDFMIRAATGAAQRGFARVHEDGSLDTSFLFEGTFNSLPKAMVLQPDGKLLVAAIPSVGAKSYLTRLHADGTHDDTFEAAEADLFPILNLSVQSDGKIVAAGQCALRRFLPSGTLDPTFTPNQIDFYAVALATAEDGQILVAGSPSSCGGWNAVLMRRIHGQVAPAEGQGHVRVAFTEHLVNEADGTVSVALLRVAGSSGSLQVRARTIDATAAAGVHYQTVDQEVIFSDGEFRKTVTVPLLPGTGRYEPRTFLLQLSDGPVEPGVFTCAVIIHDQVRPGKFAFRMWHSDTVIEDQGPFLIRLHRLEGAVGAASVRVAAHPLTATEGIQYLGVDQMVHFADGEWDKILEVPILVREERESRSTFAILLSEPSGDAIVGEAPALEVTIYDQFQPGRRDASFGTRVNNGSVDAIGRQSNGKLVLGGSFTFYDGVYSPRLMRMHADGARDAGFAAGLTPLDNAVRAVLVLPDDSIMIGGDFFSYNNQSHVRILRLTSEGLPHPGFHSGTGANGAVHALAMQLDGKLLIGGLFTHYDGVARSRITRMRPDGSIDFSFGGLTPPLINGTIRAIAIQPDGRILIGGDFTQVDGVPRFRIARLEEDGRLDVSFQPGEGADGPVRAIVLKPDGGIFIGGDLSNYDGSEARKVVQLLPSGSRDSGFVSGWSSGSNVHSLLLQEDGRLIGGGTWISRFETDGKFDPEWSRQDAAPVLHQLADGKVLATVSNSVTRLWGGDVIRPGGGEIGFGAERFHVAENAGVAAISITRGGGSSGHASATWSTQRMASGAISGVDFLPASGTVHFAPGEASKTVGVTILDNYLADGDRTFRINIDSVTGAAASFDSHTLVKIQDDDIPLDYERWRLSEFRTIQDLTDPAISGAEATQGIDDMPNLMKFFFGLPAAAPVPTSARPQLTKVNVAGNFYLAQQTPWNPLALASISLLASDDLVKWEVLPANFISEPSDVAGIMNLILRDDVPLGDLDRRFLRLLVTLP